MDPEAVREHRHLRGILNLRRHGLAPFVRIVDGHCLRIARQLGGNVSWSYLASSIVKRTFLTTGAGPLGRKLSLQDRRVGFRRAGRHGQIPDGREHDLIDPDAIFADLNPEALGP